MFRLVKFAFKAIVLIKLLSLAFSAGMAAAFVIGARQQYRSWGLPAGAEDRGLAGDELVSEPDLVETRTIDIDAPREQVWKWLAQMGYGRGGWYSFAALDRPWSPAGGAHARSADTILEEFQDLAVGDPVPAHPQGGFEARVVEPDEALVLFLDDEMTRAQMQEAMAKREAEAEAGEKGFRAEMDFDVPAYRVSWAFVLEDAPGGRTRLTERLRLAIEASAAQWKARPLLNLGVFVLLKSQLEGIKRRAERSAAAD